MELKNGETYNGHLVSCDNWMNINLREVICTSRVSALHPESALAAWGPWGSSGLVGRASGGRVARNAHWDLGLYRASVSSPPSGVKALPWTCGRSGRVPTAAYTTSHPARGGASCRGGARGTSQDVGGNSRTRLQVSLVPWTLHLRGCCPAGTELLLHPRVPPLTKKDLGLGGASGHKSLLYREGVASRAGPTLLVSLCCLWSWLWALPTMWAVVA